MGKQTHGLLLSGRQALFQGGQAFPRNPLHPTWLRKAPLRMNSPRLGVAARWPPVLEPPQTPPIASRAIGLLPAAPPGPPGARAGRWGWQGPGWEAAGIGVGGPAGPRGAGGGERLQGPGPRSPAPRAVPTPGPRPLPPVALSGARRPPRPRRPRPGDEVGSPRPRTPAHQAHGAHHHLRLLQEASQVEGAARPGRAVRPALHVAAAATPPPPPRTAEEPGGLPAPDSTPPLGAWPEPPQGPRAKCRPRQAAVPRRPQGPDRLAWPALPATEISPAALGSLSSPCLGRGLVPLRCWPAELLERVQRVPGKRGSQGGLAPLLQPLFALASPPPPPRSSARRPSGSHLSTAQALMHPLSSPLFYPSPGATAWTPPRLACHSFLLSGAKPARGSRPQFSSLA